MSNFVQRYDAFVNQVSRLAAVVAGMFILATAFIVVYEIVMRGVFNSPTEWVLEISTYLVLAAGFLGMAITLRRKAHVAVDFLLEKLHHRTRTVLVAVTTAMALALFVVFAVESCRLVATSLEYGTLSPSILRFPMWIPQSSMIAGSLLLVLELVRELLGNLLALAAKDKAVPPC